MSFLIIGLILAEAACFYFIGYRHGWATGQRSEVRREKDGLIRENRCPGTTDGKHTWENHKRLDPNGETFGALIEYDQCRVCGERRSKS